MYRAMPNKTRESMKGDAMFHDVRDALGDTPLIAAHRGACGGNIPCNTLAAFDVALHQGAEVIELDVTRSRDGKMYVFHPGKEDAHLQLPASLSSMDSGEIDRLCFVNMDRTPTQHPVVRLEEALEHLRGHCYINVDKFYMYMPELAALIRSMHMQDQVIVKTFASQESFRAMEECAADLPYMVITRHDDFTDELCRRPLRYVGTEVLFAQDTHGLCGHGYLDYMHGKGLLVWANAIVYDYREVLSGGHNDDIAATGHEDEGWGWLIDRGFDIIQTDWPLALRLYMTSRVSRRG